MLQASLPKIHNICVCVTSVADTSRHLARAERPQTGDILGYVLLSDLCAVFEAVRPACAAGVGKVELGSHLGAPEVKWFGDLM